MEISGETTSFNRSFISEDRPQRQESKVAQIASITVIVIGCAVLIGWKFDLEWLKSIIPGLATMKVNTALCLIWVGISLRLQSDKYRNSLTARIASGCTIATITIAFLTICQYLLGWNLGIDELLFSDRVDLTTVAPGRMGVNTAINFCLASAALWLVNRHDRRLSRPAQVRVDTIAIAQSLAIVVGAIALQALVGYAYQVRVYYQLNTLTTSMALHTALSFVLLAGGILALRSDRGWMRSLTTDLLGANVARRFLPAAIVLPLIVGWLILQGLKAELYDENFALSLMSMSLAAIWLGLIVKNTAIINSIDHDRTRSDDRVRSSEERLRLSLQGGRQGVWEFEEQTQILTWDDRCKEIFGLSPHATISFAGYLDLLHPDDRQGIADLAEIVFRNCGEFAQEYRTIHPDGTIHWVLSHGRCYVNQDGSPSRILGTMMDITQRKHAQLNEQFLNSLTRRLRHLTDAEKMQREAIQSLGEYLGVDRVTWFRVDWRRRLATIECDWDRSSETSHPRIYPLADFLPPEMQVALFAGDPVVVDNVRTEPSLAPYRQNYRELEIGAFTNVPSIFDQQWVATLSLNTQAPRSWRDDEVALIQAVVAQSWSLIEQTRAEQALRVEQDRTQTARAIVQQQLGEIEAIYRSAPIGLCFVNTDLQFVRINDHLAQINGLSVSEHLGRTIREVLPEMADQIEPLYQQVIESGQPILNLELSGFSLDRPGVERHWLVCYHPQQDAEDRVIGVNVMVQETTDL